MLPYKSPLYTLLGHASHGVSRGIREKDLNYLLRFVVVSKLYSHNCSWVNSHKTRLLFFILSQTDKVSLCLLHWQWFLFCSVLLCVYGNCHKFWFELFSMMPRTSVGFNLRADSRCRGSHFTALPVARSGYNSPPHSSRFPLAHCSRMNYNSNIFQFIFRCSHYPPAPSHAVHKMLRIDKFRGTYSYYHKFHKLVSNNNKLLSIIYNRDAYNVWMSNTIPSRNMNNMKKKEEKKIIFNLIKFIPLTVYREGWVAETWIPSIPTCRQSLQRTER